MVISSSGVLVQDNNNTAKNRRESSLEGSAATLDIDAASIVDALQ